MDNYKCNDGKVEPICPFCLHTVDSKSGDYCYTDGDRWDDCDITARDSKECNDAKKEHPYIELYGFACRYKHSIAVVCANHHPIDKGED